MTHQPHRRTVLAVLCGAVVRGAVATGAVVTGASAAAAAPASGAGGRVQLLYVREAGCPYCREWDLKIGTIYHKTPEARRAPLREIEKRDVPAAGLRLARPVRYTPTFVLLLDGAELGRIEGYPGEDFFWGRLDRLLEQLPADVTP
ncbi:hypothetical protein RHODGE_RHODGE_01744 [Rhodoplanes serenus]|uniref:Thioredoxin family protein n=1 Tax=Rhodoplanes serenus TaxID=200615 RepID=A0A3S4BFE4_9BRAD|nr:hypothetical protein RHODGE_RHODGE_01744 [Rhodoplanes serenus]